MYVRFQRIHAILRVVLPVAVAIDLVHSFYYVGVLVRERLVEIEEEQKRDLLNDIRRFLTKVSQNCQLRDGLFWPDAFAIAVTGRNNLLQCTPSALQECQHLENESTTKEPMVLSGEAELVEDESLLCSDPVGALLQMLCTEVGRHSVMDRKEGTQQGSEQKRIGKPGNPMRQEDIASHGKHTGPHGVCCVQKASGKDGFMVGHQHRDNSPPDYESDMHGQSIKESHGTVEAHEHDIKWQNSFLPQTFRSWISSLGMSKLPWNMPYPVESLRAFGRKAQAVASIASERVLMSLDDSTTELSNMLSQWVHFPRLDIRRKSALRFQIAPWHPPSQQRMSRVGVEPSNAQLGSSWTHHHG